MLDIVSTRILGQFGFLAKVFSIFEDLDVLVNVVATSEVSISISKFMDTEEWMMQFSILLCWWMILSMVGWDWDEGDRDKVVFLKKKIILNLIIILF